MFRPSFIVPGGCAGCRSTVLSPGGSAARVVAREVTWYLKYQVMLPDGRQTYDHVYASSDSTSYKTL